VSKILIQKNTSDGVVGSNRISGSLTPDCRLNRSGLVAQNASEYPEFTAMSIVALLLLSILVSAIGGTIITIAIFFINRLFGGDNGKV